MKVCWGKKNYFCAVGRATPFYIRDIAMNYKGGSHLRRKTLPFLDFYNYL